MQEKGLAGCELQRQLEVVGHDPRVVNVSGRGVVPLECPVAQGDVGVALAGMGLVELGIARGPCNALVMPQFLVLHVGDGRVGKDQLSGCQPRDHTLCRVHAGAKEGELKTEQTITCAGMACDVPPLGAQVWMRAEVARKGELARRQGLHTGDMPQTGQQQAATQQSGWLAVHGRVQ